MSDPLDTAGANPWRTRSSTVLYDNGFLRLREDAVIQPDGMPGSFAYVEAAAAVVGIVPISEDGQVHLVRQWRYPWQCNSWEIPAGHAEADEEPLAAAQRELVEETGLHATSWEPLGRVYASASINAHYHLYLARDLTFTAAAVQRDGAEHDLISTSVPLDAAVTAAMDGRIVHAFTVVGLLRAARRLGV
jgi:8-oxo-dGTP pyrophosphatase MutT (NUDIX family)